MLNIFFAVDDDFAKQLEKKSEDEIETILEEMWDRESDEWDLEIDKASIYLHNCFTGQKGDHPGGDYPFNMFIYGERTICDRETYGHLTLSNEVKDISKKLEDIGREWLKEQFLKYKPWEADFKEEKTIFNLWGLAKRKEPRFGEKEIEEHIDYLYRHLKNIKTFFRKVSENNKAVIFSCRP
jgi:hypothetical protein